MLLETILATLSPDQKRVRRLIEDLVKENQAFKQAFQDLVGPESTPPPNTPIRSFSVARPPILGFYWQSGPWHCLRLEERTQGHIRPIPWIRNGKPTLRQNRETESWMAWVAKIAIQLDLEPLTGCIRFVFHPGLAFTYMAWRQVPDRPDELLHPMDPDNAVKPTTDALQLNYLKLDTEKPAGAYFNDTQVVDLLVFRFPQTGTPPVNRAQVKKERRQALKKSRLAKEFKAASIPEEGA